MTNDMKSNKDNSSIPFTHGISRRKLLSTLALGSTALGTGVIGLSNLGLSNLGSSNLGTAVVSMSGEGHFAKLISPAAAQTTFFTLPFFGTFYVLAATGRITDYSEEPSISKARYWLDSLSTDRLLVFGRTTEGDRLAPYSFNSGDTEISRASTTPIPPAQYQADAIGPQIIATGTGSDTLVIYPVTALTGTATDTNRERLFVGYYAKHSAYAGDWQFLPLRAGIPAGVDLEVLVALEGSDGTQTVEAFSIGPVGAEVGQRGRVATVPEAGFLAADADTGPMSRKAFEDALTALQFGTGIVAERISTFQEFLTIAFSTTVVPTTPTTPGATIVATTTVAVSTMAATTTLVSTTGNATMAATTAGGPTLADTTLVSTTIAGELSVRGAINAQGNIGGDVARSLSGRLSSFRTRNRNKIGQRQQVPNRRR